MASGYNDFESKEKDTNNNIISFWVLKYLGEKYHPSLVLDGPSTGTSKELIKEKISIPRMIYAPQISEGDAQGMRNQKTCRVIEMTLSNAIRNVDGKGIPNRVMKKISVFNLDFMGSIFGRKRSGGGADFCPEIYPLNDFNDCLARTKARDVIISITFSNRTGSEITKDLKYFEGREHDFGEQIDQDFLIPIMKLHGYRFVKGAYRYYRREKKSTLMWFFIYYITKDETINTNEIRLPISPIKPKPKSNPKPVKRLFWGFNPNFKESYVPEGEKIISEPPPRKRSTPAYERKKDPRPKRQIRPRY